MRLRVQRRIQKQARIAAQRKVYSRLGTSNPEAILQIAMDRKSGWPLRSEAFRTLGIKRVPEFLVDEFYSAQDMTDIWEAALTIGSAKFADILDRLSPALQDRNHDRRRAAVAALAQFHHQRVPIAKALTAVIQDRAQPQSVREEACDSLTHYNWPQATPTLVDALREPAVGMRFWAAFGLGSMRHRKSDCYDPRAVAALESVLDDTEENPGWWSVGKEALGRLADVAPKYREMCDREAERIQAGPASSKQDRDWAEFYGR